MVNTTPATSSGGAGSSGGGGREQQQQTLKSVGAASNVLTPGGHPHPPLARITKADISGPTHLLLPSRLVGVQPRTHQAQQAEGGRSAPPPPPLPARAGGSAPTLDAAALAAAAGTNHARPFDSAFLDVSASQVGGGEGIPEQRSGNAAAAASALLHATPRRHLTLAQYQNLLQCFSVFARQLRAMSVASDNLVRGLEELGDCADLPSDPAGLGALGALIDCTRLLSNTHATWGQTLEREVERPYAKSIAIIQSNVASRLRSNDITIATLSKHLQNEELASYKSARRAGKSAGGAAAAAAAALSSAVAGMSGAATDISGLTASLATRMKLTQEIQRIQRQNVELPDAMAHEHIDFIIGRMERALRGQLVAYELIDEGIKKVGAFFLGLFCTATNCLCLCTLGHSRCARQHKETAPPRPTAATAGPARRAAGGRGGRG
jgi:hypothetical protein